MSRPVSEDDLHAYIDGALSDARRAEVETYLDSNPHVAERFGRFAQQRDSLRAALGPIADEPVPPQLNPDHLVAGRPRSLRPQWAAVAACLLVVLGGAGGWTLRGLGADSEVGIAALANEASYSYAVFGSDPVRAVEVSADDQDGLVRWMENRLARRVHVPDLAGAGFQLIGGRIVATQNGPAGLLMYDDTAGRRIAILMRPMIEQDRNARMAQQRRGDVVGYSWADNGMGYSLVGKDGPRRLHPVADEARRQLLSMT